MAALEAIARVPAGRCTGGQASEVPRQSPIDAAVPLGRYRTIPGARMYLYSKLLIQTVDPRNVRCRPWARRL